MTMGRLPNTGEAVIIDLGEGRDIHPRNKQDVGQAAGPLGAGPRLRHFEHSLSQPAVQIDGKSKATRSC